MSKSTSTVFSLCFFVVNILQNITSLLLQGYDVKLLMYITPIQTVVSFYQRAVLVHFYLKFWMPLLRK